MLRRSAVSDSLQPQWTIAHQAPLSMGFSWQYRIGLPCPPPGDFPNPGTEPRSALQADSLPSEPPGKPILQLKIKGKKKNRYIEECVLTKYTL